MAFFNPLETIIKKIVTLFVRKIGEDAFEKYTCQEFRRENYRYETSESMSLASQASESRQDKPPENDVRENAEEIAPQSNPNDDFFFLPPPLPPPKSTFKRILKPFAWQKSEKSILQSSFKIDKLDGEHKIEKEIRDHFKIEVGRKRQTKRELQTDNVTALSMKAQQNIQILLKKMPFYEKGNDLTQHNRLCAAILDMDFTAFTPDQLNRLKSMYPKDEIATLKKANDSQIAEMEIFILSLSRIPELELRLDIMNFRMNFRRITRDFTASVKCLHNALVAITSNKHFMTVMHVILKIGNILNENTDIGDADAFEILSLRSLPRVTSKKYNNALGYIVVFMREHYGEERPFWVDFKKVSRAFGVNRKALEEELFNIGAKTEELRKYFLVEKCEDDQFDAKMRTFYAIAKHKSAHLKFIFGDFGRLFKEVTNEETPWEMFFEEIKVFSSEYEKIELEIVKSEKRAERERFSAARLKKEND